MANCAMCGREAQAPSGSQPALCPECMSTLSRNPTPARVPPLASQRPSTWQQFPVTTAIVGLNTAVFLLMVARGMSPLEPTVPQLQHWGANWGPLSLSTQPWRMLVSNYLHGGLLHIGLNMWCLWNLGRLAERVFDRWTYVLAYTACGLAGSLNSLWWHPLVTGVGASGAIFGLAGALIAVLYLGRFKAPPEALRPTLRSLITFAGYNLLFGAVGRGIDNSAHIGGLVCGLLLGAALARVPASSREVRLQWWRRVFAVASILLFAAFAVVQRQNGYVAPLARADAALRRGQLDQAIPDLEAAHSLKPSDRITQLLLASAYSEKKDYPRAESILQSMLRHDPNDPEARYYMGLVYLDTQRYEPARAIFQNLSNQSPGRADILIFLGTALEGLGQNQQAEQTYARAVAADASNGEAARSLGLMQLKNGNAEQALSTLQAAAQRAPDDAATQRALARAYHARGMDKEATAALDRAEALDRQKPKPTDSD